MVLRLSSIAAIPSFTSIPSRFLGLCESHPSVPGNRIDHQHNTTDRHVGDRLASDCFSTQPPQVSREITPSGLVPPNAIRMPEPHSHGVQQPTLPASSSNHTDSVQAQPLLAPPSPPLAATPSQQSLNPDPLINPAMFNQAQNFTVTGGNFIGSNVTNNNNPSPDQFMEKLLEKTIPGAEFDSSARDPPPRCHPGTRLEILDRCLYFIHNSDGMTKTRWVFGAAGVGKSAIMQSVVESPTLAVSCHASVFFSINGRDDGTKTIVTISYQLAAKSEPYRQLIEREITRDPSLLRSSMAKQFLKLIAEPFIHNPQLNSSARVLIVIDGLDECKNSDRQLELLRLISDLCINYPSSPLVWLIASRPETHITSFFSQSDVTPAYEKEEILVDSEKARADVERFLRAELAKIKKKALDTVDPRWPEEQDLWKLANAAGGLFAYAQTAVRYIGDTTVGSPASQLSDVLNVIDSHPMTDLPPEDHPMALLDALYARILSNVPSKVIMNTRKLLLALAFKWKKFGPTNFIILCNWLGMTPDEAYAALNHLRSVLRVPKRDEAHKVMLRLFHKSFMDYISDYRRSGFSGDIKHEAQQLVTQCVFRILNEAPDGIDFIDAGYGSSFGSLRRGPGTGDNISVTWPVDEEVGRDDNATRLSMYELAIEKVVAGMGRGKPTFQSEFYIHILSTRFEKCGSSFPFALLCNLVFDESRRQEFMARGIIKQMPVKAIDVSRVFSNETVGLQFRRSAIAVTKLSDILNEVVRLRFRHFPTTVKKLSEPWNSACYHERSGEQGEEDDQDWNTDISLQRCDFCSERFQRLWEDWKTQSPDHAVPTFFTSTGWCCVECRFVGSDDGISEWTYQFWVKLSLEQRKKYGSDV